MKNGEFTDKELEIAKKEFKDRLRTSSYGQKNVVEAINNGQTTPYGSNMINEKFDIIDSMTKEDVQKAAQYAFANKPIYSIVASKDTLEANKKFFNELEQA